MTGGTISFGLEVRRHWLVNVVPSAWAEHLASRPDLAAEPLLVEWADREWPLVVRRRCDGDNIASAPLGLPLPPSHGKQRIALDLEPNALHSFRPALRLAEVRHSAPPVWHRTIDALLDLGREHGAEPRVFGSFAWTALTGLNYVGTRSDLDLLWPLTADTPALLTRLAVIEADAPGAIDGEIEGDGWVNWRELAGNAADVVVKSMNGVSLSSTVGFLRSFKDRDGA